MEKQLKCKVCSYIITEMRLGEVCPACGVPKTAFEEYRDRVSQKRRKILELNLHPIIVHFPQAIAVMVFGLLLISLILSGSLKRDFMIAIRVLTILLPWSVFACAFVACGRCWLGRLHFVSGASRSEGRSSGQPSSHKNPPLHIFVHIIYICCT